ncbi:MAG: putative beta-lysine N-acetyltransferase [Candidatus Sericytochromatia bacterium]|nr:putative beta-lysine N-acetyltransferase [Candidatus Sericytochromatia bacterium]
MSHEPLPLLPPPGQTLGAWSIFSNAEALALVPRPRSKAPTGKGMGVVRLVLDDDVSVEAYGAVYGIEHTIHDANFRMTLTVDHYNRRLKVARVEGDPGLICAKLERLAEANGFDKVTLKVEREHLGAMLAHGYKLEGLIPQFFRGQDAYVVSRFLSAERFSFDRFADESEMLRQIAAKPRRRPADSLPSGYTMCLATPDDIEDLVTLYEGTFETYPSPVASPDFLLATMQSHVRYALMRNGRGQLVSAASADIDFANGNAELTDCATLPTERGRGLMLLLLDHLERVIRPQGVRCAYSMARAMAPGMNRVFHNLGYGHYGRLINNCDISGDFEDINLWVKPLD